MRWLIVAAVAVPVLAGTAVAGATTMRGSGGSADPVSLFTRADTGRATVDPDDRPVEVGVRFTTRDDGYIQAVKFLPVPGDAAVHPVSVWAAGELLATASSTGAGAGWQSVSLPKPLRVKAGTEYVASYHTNRYMTTQRFFDRATTNGPLKAPAKRNGVFRYDTGDAAHMPDQSWNASNYWVDVVFSTRPSGSVTQPPPPPTTSSPVASAKPTASSSTGTPKPTTSVTPPTTFPNASNTGVVPADAKLTPTRGTTVTTAGAVLENLDISGTVRISAPGVTIRNCKIHGDEPFGVQVLTGSVRITDTEIFGFGEAAIAFDNWEADRVNIHSMGADGVKTGSNTTLKNSYLHGFTPKAGAHADGVQLQNGATNVTISHNTIFGPSTAMFMAPDLGPSGAGPVVIDGNLLRGGNYTLQIVDGDNGKHHQKGYAVTNNRFERGAQYGPVTTNEPSSSFTAWTGNVWHDTGAPINR
ncbi:DUF4082 domain-containing protein [Virgisporangium aurantiacum]|uniref:DUF4082 domain-containing protein n=1 Tax=Virgisporangium aurantiacum TaxID=175570 RepID=UPI001951468E|nr:DUF4082 domain-containing protein [Virgisporangium aurantiacum]